MRPIYERVVEPRLEAMNEAIDEAELFVTELAIEAEDEFDNSDPKWQASSRGEAWLEWVCHLEEAANAFRPVELAPATYDEMPDGPFVRMEYALASLKEKP